MNIFLDETGDWLVEDGKLQLVTGQDEIAQISAIRLKTYLGEWFLDVRIGFPWFSKVLKKGPNTAEIEALLIQEIVETPGIVSLRSFDLSFDKVTRKLKVDYEAESIAGIINFSEVI